MKKLYIIRNIAVGVLLASTSVSCSDYLDKETFDLITPEKVWQDPKLINGVLVKLYDGLQTEDLNYWWREQWRLVNLSSASDDAQGSFQKEDLFDDYNKSYTYEDNIFETTFSDRYNHIRNCNDFLAQLEEAQGLSETEKKALIGEVRFLRAFHYFTLVKRYGGVPIISAPQEYDPNNLEALMVPRDKEEDVYNFIITECQAAAQDLPSTRDASVKYRATKWSALALVSRAALYAGSIAKYGKVQLDGLVGIPSSSANKFFQTSIEASNQVISSGVFSLKIKGDNFASIFTKTTNGDNDEYIFQKQYNVAGGKGHDWDKRNAPFSHRAGGWGCGIAPTLELVEAYEYVDGSEGTLKLNDDNGQPIHFKNLIDVFKDKDPRMFGSIYVPGSPIKDTYMSWLRGYIGPDGTRYPAVAQPDQVAANTVTIDGKPYFVSGTDGGADAGDASKTGFYQKKFFDETLTNVNMGQSSTPWVIFRLAEMYLNLAEASMETGNASAALTAVNVIRERAGIVKLNNIDLDKVRHERRVELAFEGHRFWDLRRWRLADKDAPVGLNNFRGTGLYPWYNMADDTYIYERGDHTPKRLRIFQEKNYYTRINQSDMNSNPKLVQNPGYTN